MADNFLDKMAGIQSDNFLDVHAGIAPKPKPKSIVQRIAGAVAPYTRDALPMAGAMLGGVMGATGGAVTTLPAAGTGAIPGGIAGAGLGYAAAQQGQNLIEQLAGMKKPKIALEETAQTGKDFTTGAGFEATGPIMGAIVGPMARFASPYVSKMTSKIPAIGTEPVRRKVGEIIEKASGSNPIYKKNAEAAVELEKQIPGYKATIGERTNDPALIRLQRSIEKGSNEGVEMMAQRRQGNLDAIRKYIDSEFNSGRTVDDVIDAIVKARTGSADKVLQASKGVESAASRLKGADPQTAGRTIHEKIKKAIEPVVKQEGELWAKVENYPVPTSKLESSLTEALSVPSTAKPILKKIQKVVKETPPTVQGLRRIEMEIDSAINNQATTATERHYLKGVKKGVQDDITALGDAADSGQIMIHEGKVIYPQALKDEAAGIPQRITEAGKGMQAKPDTQAIMLALRDAKVPFQKAIGESNEGHIARIMKQYEDTIGKEIPMIKPQEPALIQTLKTREADINRILSEAQPADNVAQAIKTAKDFSRDQKFGRFDKGAVKDILRRGAEINGRSVADADVARRFMNVDDADQLIKAIGPQNAKEVMQGFIVSDFEKSVVDKTTGEIGERALNNWLSKNYQTLERYGIAGDFANVSKAQKALTSAKMEMDQFNKSIAAKILNSDPEKAIEVAMQGGEGISGKNTGAIMSKLMRQLKGNPDAINGLKESFKDFIKTKSENAAKTIAGDSTISAVKIQKELRKYEPAMRILYADEPRKLLALQNVQKAIETSARSIASPTGGGSDTFELMSTSLGIVAKCIEHVPFGSASMVIARKGLGWLNTVSKQEVDKVLARAIYDPEIAQVLMMARQGKPPNAVKRSFVEALKRVGIYETLTKH